MNAQHSTDILDSLVTAGPSEKVARQLLNWARELLRRVARGDMMIGILSIDEVERLPTGSTSFRE